LEGKGSLVEDNMSCNIKTTSGNIKTLITSVRLAVAEKNTRFRAKRKFMGVIRSKIRPTLTSKGFEKAIIRRLKEQKLKRSCGTSGSEREFVYKITSSVKCMILVLKRNMGVREESKPGINNMPKSPFNTPILVMSVRTSETMSDARGRK
jgi:hypothetical protein